MGLKEITQRILHSFFILLGGSLIAMYVFILLFGEDRLIHTNDITALLIMTIIIDLAYFIFYSKKELNEAQMRVRHFIHLLSALLVVFLAAYYMEWINFGESVEIITMVVLVTGIYLIMIVLSVYRTKKLADKLNQKLKERYDKG